MIKAIFFDLDNTLYDYFKTSDPALEKVYLELKKEIKISKQRFLKILNKSKKEVRNELNHSPDSHDRIIYFQRTGEKLNLNLKFVLKLYGIYYSNFLKTLKPRKGILKTFKEIKKQDLKIVIITNEVVEIQLRKVKKLGIMNYLDYFVASENAGIDKPHKKIFLRALNKVKLKPSEVLMVGDSELDDINGAKKIGIKSVLLQTKKNQKTKADYKIKKIPELLKIIDSLNKEEKRD